MSGQIPNKDQKILCLRSGNKCALPDCRKDLVISSTHTKDDHSIIGEMAHIKGEKSGAARYDATMAAADRNKHANLIMVCRDHHKVIDDQPNTYTVEKLHEIKSTHEAWVMTSMSSQVSEITFAELSVVTNYLLSGQGVPTDNFTLITPKDKINRNGLSGAVEQLITMGMTQVSQVRRFVTQVPDNNFGDRLKQGFIDEYERLKREEGVSGDELFDCLLDFAAARSHDFKQRAAGLAVLVYLFEMCEIFEK